MSKDNVLALRNPGIASEVSDVLTQVLRDGAQQMLARAIEAEGTEFLERYRFDMDQAGRARGAGSGRGQISRLKAVWQDDQAQRERWDLRISVSSCPLDS